MIAVLEDRADGTLWQLTHRQSDARFAIRDDAVPAFFRGQVRQYSAFDGPVMGFNPRVRLLIRDGRLGYEMVVLGQGITDRDNARILTRRGNEQYSLEVTDGDWLQEGDTLGWSTVEGLD